jgi:hypothetical protein
VQPSFPIRAAFYYPWFPETWGGSPNPFSHYTPTLGFYDSSSATVIRSHVASMLSGGIEAGIASWWGQGSKTDTRIPALLSNTADPFRWALYYEPEGTSDPSSTQINSDLSYISSHYGSNRAYLRVGGKPVLFVYGGGNDACAMAQRWISANAGRFYLVLKVFGGYRTCASQPNSWHQYAPAVRSDAQLPYSYSVSPGFFKANESSARLARSLPAFTTAAAAMAASGAQWQLVTTFNEWGEGSSIEPSTTWGTSYLQALGAPSQPPPSSSPPPVPGGMLVGAAGDICDNTPIDCKGTSDLVIQKNPALVLALGDTVYDSGTLAEYAAQYEPNWGRFKSKTQAAVGNHEYGTPNAAGFRTYFGFPATGVLYNSFNSGGWHFVRMDTDHMTATEVAWATSDLAADGSTCEIAYGHHPRWSSGSTHGSDPGQDAMWKALAAQNVDIVLYGHDHDYERFGLINGMREFVVGTGGANPYTFGTVVAGSQVRIQHQFGVLFLTLGASSYSWQFINSAGSVLDSGSDVCH